MKSQLDTEAAKVVSTSGSDPMSSYLAYKYLSRPTTNNTFKIFEETFVFIKINGKRSIM
ncbi:hypothetical protein [Leptospira kirschneri]|uniref:hypothetical protein n=1 Tax=Leptospira kirschneri TaxID=29507 RepID=UPI0018800678|nr:hypothetical protein [Leptospira kirschneri]